MTITGCPEETPLSPTGDIVDVTAANFALAIGYNGTDNASSVTLDIILPKSAGNGVSVSWVCSDPTVITVSGTTGDVTRPAAGQSNGIVTLTATLSKNDSRATKTFVLTVIATPENNEAILTEASNVLIIIYATNENANAVSNNIILPVSASNGVSISWASSSAVIAVSETMGIISRPAAGQSNRTVTLTATLSKNDARAVKIFVLTVIARPDNSEAILTEASDALMIGYAVGESSNAVSNHITLPASASNGVSISWVSRDPAVIAVSENPGTVTRPEGGSPNAEVTLTAILSKNDITVVKTFVLTVIAIPQTDEMAVLAAIDALMIGYAAGESSNAVINHILLPTNADNGVSVSWVSRDPAVISVSESTGTVNRPTTSEGDQTVTLNAILSKGTASLTNDFTLTVLALPDNDMEAVVQASNTLAIIYAPGESSAAVTNNITLITNGENEVVVSWEIISGFALSLSGERGVITRPMISEGNAVVFLRATLTRGAITRVKNFSLNVIAEPIPDIHGNTTSRATVVTNGSVVIGYIHAGTDRDVFSIVIDGPEDPDLILRARSTGSLVLSGIINNERGEYFRQRGNYSGSLPVFGGGNFDHPYRVRSPGRYYITVIPGEGGFTPIHSVAPTPRGEYILHVSLENSTPDDHGNNRADATPITNGSTTEGSFNLERFATDLDYFSIEVDGPGTLRAYNGIGRQGTSFSSAIGCIKDNDGADLVCDKEGRVLDLSYNIEAAGVSTYYIAIERARIARGRLGVYQLVVEFVRDPDAVAVEEASEALTIGYAPGEGSLAVTNNITLITNGSNDVAISWEIPSSVAAVLSLNGEMGVVTRPTGETGDTIILLTARLTKDAITRTKNFFLTVIARPRIVDDYGNSRGTATRVTNGSSVDGNIEVLRDRDFFQIEIDAVRNLRIFSEGGSGPTLHLFDNTQTGLLKYGFLIDNYLGDESDFDVTITLPPGLYYFAVENTYDDGDFRLPDYRTGPYTVNVSVTDIPADDHGDTLAEATLLPISPTNTSVSIPATISSTSSPQTLEESTEVNIGLVPADVDFFSFRVDESQVGHALRATSTGLSTIASLYRPPGIRAFDDHNGLGEDDGFKFSRFIKSAGVHYIAVWGRSVHGIGDYTLELSVKPPGPDDHGNSREQATVITNNSATTGNLDLGRSSDVDYFQITVDGPGTLRVFTHTPITRSADTMGRIENSEGVVLISGKDGGLAFNFDISYDVTEAGTYYIAVERGESTPTIFGLYRLHVSFTRDE